MGMGLKRKWRPSRLSDREMGLRPRLDLEEESCASDNSYLVALAAVAFELAHGTRLCWGLGQSNEWVEREVTS